MLTNLGLADLRLTTAQQRTTGQSLSSGLYIRCTRNPGALEVMILQLGYYDCGVWQTAMAYTHNTACCYKPAQVSIKVTIGLLVLLRPIFVLCALEI
jgi:hypothetical protein